MIDDASELKLKRINRALGIKPLVKKQTTKGTLSKPGYYPSIWKNEYVTPIPKKDTPNDFSGIRPITLTPVQFRNIFKTSTAHYLASMLDTILKHLDESERWINLVAIDLKKAVDLICHSTLIKNFLSKFNTNPFLERIMANVLANRKHRTKYKSTFSNKMPIFSAVPQGKMLGTLLFQIVVNELTTGLKARQRCTDEPPSRFEIDEEMS
ncbi:hypothetical protein QYM36_018529 [Artemia franciscana]|uniref:Reverse transcriptase domain-containing protein n=1 Tax=Artemia franciscana TaxID=6661 RepID=A0AA88HCP0_ARTSF|nr:hypothetical protein QYM36_018529 [Artemia franciscana]